jgi:hypothetical protein
MTVGPHYRNGFDSSYRLDATAAHDRHRRRSAWPCASSWCFRRPTRREQKKNIRSGKSSRGCNERDELVGSREMATKRALCLHLAGADVRPFKTARNFANSLLFSLLPGNAGPAQAPADRLRDCTPLCVRSLHPGRRGCGRERSRIERRKNGATCEPRSQPEYKQHGRVALGLELRRAGDLRLADRSDAGGDGDVLFAIHRVCHRRSHEARTDIDLP